MKKVMFAGAVISVLALGLSAVPAFASYHYQQSGSTVSITSSNSAFVSNTVNGSASTGDNTANGGNGKNGGAGGLVETGNANAGAFVSNVVNSNKTTTGDCLCNGKVKSITVKSTNSAFVSNTVTGSASTGDNTANGGNGSTSKSERDSKGGNGGDGGLIETGNAGTGAGVSNYINSNVTSL